jgi:hypothetical protein
MAGQASLIPLLTGYFFYWVFSEGHAERREGISKRLRSFTAFKMKKNSFFPPSSSPIQKISGMDSQRSA